MNSKRLLFAAIVLVALALLWLWIGSSEPIAGPEAEMIVDSGANGYKSHLSRSNTADDPPRQRGGSGVKRMDAERRQELLKAILVSMNNSGENSESRADTPKVSKRAFEDDEQDDNVPVGSLDKEYIKQQINEIVPLVRECYEMTLENQQGLEGTVHVTFTIIGDPEYGGLVETSRITKEALSEPSEQLNECLRETMYPHSLIRCC